MQTSSLQHYVYKITCLETGEYYYGKRSCNGSWKDDPYMGSGLLLNDKMKAHPDYTWRKEVLLLLETSEEAYEYEALIIGNKFKGGSDWDGLCLNLTLGGSGGSSPGATGEELVKREERTRIILEGGIISGVRCIDMSNDELQQYVVINITPYNLSVAKKLISLGWYVGQVRSYTKVTLRNLGMRKVDIYQECFLRGEIPEGCSKFCFINNELKQQVSVSKSPRTLEIVGKLLNSGWCCGTNFEYEKMNIKKLNLNSARSLEELFLSGKNCPVSSFRMSLNDTYVQITQPDEAKDMPFHPATKILYNRGWRFGRLDKSRKVKLSTVSQP